MYLKNVCCLISKSALFLMITSCDLLGILYKIYMFPLFISKNIESKEGRKRKGERKRKKEKEGREKKKNGRNRR